MHSALWAQEKTFENQKLRQAASGLSKEYPFVDLVYSFTEKYLNQLLQLSPNERIPKMRQDGVRIEEGDLKLLQFVNDETSLSVKTQSNHYIVSLVNAETPLIRISFPMSYQLITGKKLKELEDDFIRELENWNYQSSLNPDEADKNEMRRTALGMYLKRGGVYYIEEINNHQYYVEENNHLQLVYSPEHVAESFCNMMVSENTPCEIELKLTIQQYGFKTHEMKVPLKQWISYCKSKGCDLYAGIEKLGTDKLTGCVFVVNEPFKYNHVMNLKLPYTILKEQKGTIEANIMVYIPTHNLLSLFDEFDMFNKK